MNLENYFADYRIDDPESYDHWFSHHLGIAVRFVDVFTGGPINAPLRVSAPAQQWTAVRRTTDDSYRFLFTETAIPAGVFDLQIDSLSGEYQSLQPAQITLPVVSGPPPVRADYIMTLPLWPTRQFQFPAGETGIIGRIVSGGTNSIRDLQVRLFPQGTAPAAAPAAFSNSNGEFVYRLPWHGPRMTGSTVNAPPTVAIDMVGPGGSIGAVAPAIMDPPSGQVHSQTFTIP